MPDTFALPFNATCLGGAFRPGHPDADLAGEIAASPVATGLRPAEARWFTAADMPVFPGAGRSIARWILRNFTAGKGKQNVS
jgi:hypothetical protein